MSKQAVIKQYYLIINKINKHKYCTYKDILTYLQNNDFEPSQRTFQRYLDAIRNEFNIDIVYDKNQRGYYIDDDSISFQTFIKYLELSITCDFIIETIQEGKKSLDYIQFESSDQLKNIEYLKDLFIATKKSKIIHFEYFNFFKNTLSKIELQPYLIKEYHNRWYIIGTLASSGEERTFALDRMNKLNISSKSFTKISTLKAKDEFSKIIGVNYQDGKVVKVVLKYDRYQSLYVQSLPLHPSQEVMKEDDKYVWIALYLIPNYELQSIILSQGNLVEVIEPASLRESIAESIAESMKIYRERNSYVMLWRSG